MKNENEITQEIKDNWKTYMQGLFAQDKKTLDKMYMDIRKQLLNELTKEQIEKVAFLINLALTISQQGE